MVLTESSQLFRGFDEETAFSNRISLINIIFKGLASLRFMQLFVVSEFYKKKKTTLLMDIAEERTFLKTFFC